MSECGPDCTCDEAQARQKCPQACGRPYPACGCLTAEEKEAELLAYQNRGRRRRRPRRNETITEMMVRLGAKW